MCRQRTPAQVSAASCGCHLCRLRRLPPRTRASEPASRWPVRLAALSCGRAAREGTSEAVCWAGGRAEMRRVGGPSTTFDDRAREKMRRRAVRVRSACAYALQMQSVVRAHPGSPSHSILRASGPEIPLQRQRDRTDVYSPSTAPTSTCATAARRRLPRPGRCRRERVRVHVHVH
ncbi:hypothetical protein DFH11DRAFT_1614379 [Phellopilus nigrolimitatus]|nr:hypothetical protein DFH11DRAFT_1614379 [Phellopilus nigrolimitatus]